MKNIVIIGAGDLGKELVWLIEDINKVKPTYVILGFLDGDEKKTGKQFYGYDVLGTESKLAELEKERDACAVIAVQEGSIRKKIVEEHADFRNWETIKHPTAVIAESSQAGSGCIFFPQVTVSVDSRLGSFGLYYIHAVVCNDCEVGDYVSVMSGASVSEHVEVGSECFLSAGSCVYPHKRLGSGVRVGVGTTVSKDYENGAKVDEKGLGFFLLK